MSKFKISFFDLIPLVKGGTCIGSSTPDKGWAMSVVERFNKTFEDTRVFAGTEFDYCPPNPDVGSDHAALWETGRRPIYGIYVRIAWTSVFTLIGPERP